MSFDWKEYFDLGLFMHGLNPQNFTQEAAYRCSVSRIYYSCYHLAYDYALSNLHYTPFIGTESGRNHRGVRDAFLVNFPVISRKLNDLHRRRKQCDYDDTVQGLTMIVNSSIADARQIISNL